MIEAIPISKVVIYMHFQDSDIPDPEDALCDELMDLPRCKEYSGGGHWCYITFTYDSIQQAEMLNDPDRFRATQIIERYKK